MGRIYMLVLAFVPFIFGSARGASNERQLLYYLMKKVEKGYIITFATLKNLRQWNRREYNLNKAKIVPIPVFFPDLYIFIAPVISIILSTLMYLLGIARKLAFIYVRGSFSSLGFLLYKELAEKTAVKFSAFIEEEIPYRRIKRIISIFFKTYDKLALARAKKIITPSPLFYLELIKKYKIIPREPPIIIPAGIDLRLINTVKRKIISRKKDATINVGFVGSLYWWQGVHLLVQAIAILKKKIKNIRLIIIGDGHQRKLIEHLCKKVSIEYEITGFLPYIEALKRFLELDILVVPRLRTTNTELIIPKKVIEAWALGIPVVTTYHRVYSYYGVKNFKHVIFCEPNPSSIVKAILCLINNEELRNRLIINGYRMAEKFHYEKLVSKFLIHYM